MVIAVLRGLGQLSALRYVPGAMRQFVVLLHASLIIYSFVLSSVQKHQQQCRLVSNRPICYSLFAFQLSSVDACI